MIGRGTSAEARSAAPSGTRQMPGAPFRQFTHRPQGVIRMASSQTHTVAPDAVRGIPHFPLDFRAKCCPHVPCKALVCSRLQKGGDDGDEEGRVGEDVEGRGE